MPSDGESLGILILDDQLPEAEFFRDLLEFHHFRVAIASDVDAAVQELKYGDYRVFVTDHRMGGIDGVKACRRALEEKHDTKFVLVAYRDLSEEELKELYDESVIFFKKPFMPYEFVSKIESLFS